MPIRCRKKHGFTEKILHNREKELIKGTMCTTERLRVTVTGVNRWNVCGFFM